MRNLRDTGRRKSDLESKVRDFIDEGGLVPRDAGVLIAVSGGPDSVALFRILLAINDREARGWRIEIAHLNHGLRGAEADADAEFVQRLGEEFRTLCHLGWIDVPAMAGRSGRGIEDAARNARYRFLGGIARERGMGIVAVGHNADDQAETVLLHMVRGSGLRGLAGMTPSRPMEMIVRGEGENRKIRLVRPLLASSRREIEDYLRSLSQTSRTDGSNRSPDFARNRIRNEIMPLLRARLNPRVGDALRRMAEIAGSADEMLSALVADAVGRLKVEQMRNSIGMDADVMADMPAVMAYYVMESLFELQDCFPVSAESLGRLRLAAGGQGRQTLGRGWNAWREGNRLKISREKGKGVVEDAARKDMRDASGRDLTKGLNAGNGEIPLQIPGRTELAHLGIVIEAETVASEEKAELISDFRISGGTSYACRATPSVSGFSIFGPIWEGRSEIIDATGCGMLVVRTRRPGDRFHPLGAPGAKKLKEFLRESDVPEHFRDRIALVCDGERIVWVVGLRIAEGAKVTPATRDALRLIAKPMRSSSGADCDKQEDGKEH
ncbi:MAG TPA: tRNA lysidine(34) synthetase TilS [Candidatus Brocadiia bacterium]|nr:tRNA lysidine(34) synthetase TilS [Candidatus Brocadiia bacterium]